jgi:hypothetical protein
VAFEIKNGREWGSLADIVSCWNGFLTARQRAELIDRAYADDEQTWRRIKGGINYEGHPTGSLFSIYQTLNSGGYSIVPFLRTVRDSMDKSDPAESKLRRELEEFTESKGINL